MSHSISSYYDLDLMGQAVDAGRHREVVGGLWDTLGPMQLELLVNHGLKTSHKLLDIGCGSLRGGTHFIRFLDPAHYFGMDLNQTLLDAGYAKELVPLGLQDRLPPTNLIADGHFDFSRFGMQFDRAIAFSLFTHLPMDTIRVCLERLATVMVPGGVFYATYFETPDHLPSHQDILHCPGDITTHGGRDPYHHRISDFQHLLARLPWDMDPVGDFGHPRDQKLIRFTRRADAKATNEAMADLSVEKADLLAPGDSHYRAYVGPPGRYDFIAASQFALLFQLGLRDNHKVLDFGCGSIRLGRLLVPFLREGCYFGIDPNRWLIEEGIDRELGRSAIALKKPRFSYNDDFNCSVFGEHFDFTIAQSIITHTGPDLLHKLLSTASEAIADGGIFIFSYISDPNAADLPPDGWHYPGCVGYSQHTMEQILHEHGLVSVELPWHHPGARWQAAALRPEDLPKAETMVNLSGLVAR